MLIFTCDDCSEKINAADTETPVEILDRLLIEDAQNAGKIHRQLAEVPRWIIYNTDGIRLCAGGPG